MFAEVSQDGAGEVWLEDIQARDEEMLARSEAARAARKAVKVGAAAADGALRSRGQAISRVGDGRRRFAPVRTGSRCFSRGIAHCTHYLHYPQVFTLFARYSHYLRAVRKYSRGRIRTRGTFLKDRKVFARGTIANTKSKSRPTLVRMCSRASVADGSHCIRNSSRRVASIHICE